MRGIRKHLTTVVVAFVTASVVASGTAAVAAIINADKLNGYKANQLVRVAAARSTSAINPLPTANLVTATLVAPNKGYLVMVASSAIDDEGANSGNVHCWLTLDGTELAATERVYSVDPSTAAVTQQGCSTSIAWPVAAGTHKIRLVGDNPDFLNAFLGPATVTVLFEPFNGSGKVPTALTPS